MSCKSRELKCLSCFKGKREAGEPLGEIQTRNLEGFQVPGPRVVESGKENLLICDLVWLIGWLGGWVVGWLGGWVVGWLGGWVVGWS